MKVFILMLLLALPCGAFAQLPTSGLVAWYPFCGNANDYSGNGYNLTDSGAILTTDRFGSANCAYYFNGIDNELYLNSILPLPSSDFTMSFWLVADTIQDAEVVYNGNTNIDGVGIIYDNGAFLPGYNVTMLEEYICDCITVYEPLRQWHHVVLRCSAGSFNLIIDTVLVGTITSPFNPPTGKFAVGMDYSNGTNPFSGKIDDIAIYSRALSDSEIRQLYYYDPTCTVVSLIACDSISLPDTLHACSEIPVTLPARGKGFFTQKIFTRGGMDSLMA